MNMKTITRINRNARPDCSKYISVNIMDIKKSNTPMQFQIKMRKY